MVVIKKVEREKRNEKGRTLTSRQKPKSSLHAVSKPFVFRKRKGVLRKRGGGVKGRERGGVKK